MKHASAVHWTKVCREMECPLLFWHCFIELACHSLAVHDNKHLHLASDLLGQGFWRISVQTNIEGHSRKEAELLLTMRTEFFHAAAEERSKSWLRGRAENRCASIVLNERPDCCHAWLEEIERNHLCFVEDDEAVHYIMQFPALRRPACIK